MSDITSLLGEVCALVCIFFWMTKKMYSKTKQSQDTVDTQVLTERSVAKANIDNSVVKLSNEVHENAQGAQSAANALRNSQL